MGRGFANALLGVRNVYKMSVPPWSNFFRLQSGGRRRNASVGIAKGERGGAFCDVPSLSTLRRAGEQLTCEGRNISPSRIHMCLCASYAYMCVCLLPIICRSIPTCEESLFFFHVCKKKKVLPHRRNKRLRREMRPFLMLFGVCVCVTPSSSSSSPAHTFNDSLCEAKEGKGGSVACLQFRTPSKESEGGYFTERERLAVAALLGNKNRHRVFVQAQQSLTRQIRQHSCHG